ncbi:MAG: AAA family ATPase, partial [Acidimicrobiales bacterium]
MPPPKGVLRPRLARLFGDIARHRLTVVTGPAGTGKSVALAHAVASTDADVAWYRAAPGEGEVAPLVANLQQSCVSLRPDWVDNEARWTSVEEAASALGRWKGRLVVVIDDLHTLAGSPAEAAIERLIGWLPSTVAVVLAGRLPPRFDLGAHRVAGDLLEVGSDDLWFRSWEIERLVRDGFGQPLAPEEIAELTRVTGGWAAALYLFQRAAAGCSLGDRARVLAALPSSQPVRDHLVRHVLGELTAEARDFLLQTSVLSWLSPMACDRLLDTSGSEALLAELAGPAGVLFDLGGSYRCPVVLAEAARAELREALGTEGDAAWQRRAEAIADASPFFDDLSTALLGEPTWNLLQRALRGDPMGVAERAGTTGDRQHRFVAGVAWLLAGHFDRSRQALAGLVADPDAPPSMAVLARLATALAGAIVPASEAIGLVERAAGDAEQVAPEWVAALARATVGLVEGDEQADEVRERAAARDRLGDRWGAALQLLFGGLGGVQRALSSPTPLAWDSNVGLLEEAIARLRELDSPVLEAWARSALAIASARRGSPEATTLARTAER